MSHAKLTLIGRSSSHFTRVVRIYASELQVDYSLQVVRDLMSREAEDYGGNPALRLPTLRSDADVWFGALNICRELSRRASVKPRLVWPEDLAQALVANAQELVVQAMATEVGLILSGFAEQADLTAHQAKQRKSLLDTLSWLERNAQTALARLPPERDLSYLEVTLFCLMTHLDFRHVVPTTPYPELQSFCRDFAGRASAAETSYRFDA